ncbi:MAG: chemotaxis protein CheW [Desulfobacterales bacterium]|nr:chemotaxis protein CheW [Desulfobacterales bacterium]
MIFEDAETLHMYVEESLEHLANIETELLEIEEAGADIDEELVNSVFRAAHSIKGGAGFMGLSNIKELAHKIENVLGMIRSREIVPNSNVVSIVLKSFDKLRDLINDIENSNDIETSEEIVALIGLTTASLPSNQKDIVLNMVDIFTPNGKKVFTVSQFDVTQAQKQGKYIYLVEYDLIKDIHQKNKTPMSVITSMQNSGIIMESKIDVGAVGSLDADVPMRIPFLVLFASIIEPDIISALVDLEDKYVHTITENLISLSKPENETSKEKESEPEFSIKTEPEIEPEPAPEVEIEPEPEPEPEPIKPKKEPKKAVAAKPKVEKVTPPKQKNKPVETIQVPEHEDMEIKTHEDEKESSMEAKSAKSSATLRVNVSLLDTLMTLAGEMVLSRNQLLQAILANDERAIEISSQRINMVTSELQEAIMRTRLQPIANIFNKFPRVVRDLTKELSKEIDLNIEGKEVELDKTIIEAISDPLTHLVRNAVDHGIESPEKRRKAGKRQTGKVTLRAYHGAGQVNIEIIDDGKGIDGDKIASAAVDKGLLTEQQVSIMSEKEKTALIFLPGLSTAEKVTDVSGRGVGMDVVKTNLDRLGGLLDIDSKVGEGTLIRIKLPLTLAIIPSQIVSVGKERYAIPQVNLDELLRIPPHLVKERIELVGGAEVVRLRGNLLPLLNLSDILDIQRVFVNPEDGKEYPDRRKKIADRRSKQSPLFYGNNENDEKEKNSKDSSDRKVSDRRFHSNSAINIAVVSAGAFKYGLVVDQLKDSEEIVVKPLGRHLKGCSGYAGATIMGDGRVVLILDVAGLAQMAGLSSMEGTDRVGEAAKLAREAEKDKKDRASLLVFRIAEDEQFSVPLSLVERIERINASDVEHVGGKRVIQYRGGSLPLIELKEVSNVKPLPQRKQHEVIVFRITGKEVGLLATPPVDAVDVSVSIDSATLRQPGIIGSAIINKHTTLMIDIFEVVKIMNPAWFDEKTNEKIMSRKSQATILFPEDSNFFRKQVKSFLEEDGYIVIEAIDGKSAWDILQERVEEIDIVVTDLEMPNMDGFELTSLIKNDERFSHLPVIALTSLASDEDQAKGKAVGIDSYMIKLEREKLLDCIKEYLSSK